MGYEILAAHELRLGVAAQTQEQQKIHCEEKRGECCEILAKHSSEL